MWDYLENIGKNWNYVRIFGYCVISLIKSLCMCAKNIVMIKRTNFITFNMNVVTIYECNINVVTIFEIFVTISKFWKQLHSP